MRKLISFVVISILVNGIFSSNLFASTYFSDVPKDAWYRSDLDYVMQDSRKIVVGFPDGTFKPENTFTVAQLATCIVVSSYYTDLKNVKSIGKWYVPFVDKAKDLKYILDGEFTNYDLSVTRGEMSRMLVRAAENVSGKYNYRDVNKIKVLIKDYDSIPDSLKDFVVKAYDMGLISGFPDGTFGADKYLNRAQAVAVLRKLIDPTKRANVKLDEILLKNTEVPMNDKVYKVNPDMPQELYQYEYKSRDWDNSLQTNKWLVEKYGLSKITELMSIGKNYIESFYNENYHTYDKAKYIESLKWFFMPQTKWTADDGIKRPIEEHIKYWADMIEEKKIAIKTQFITDPSLVYARGDSVIRGKLIYQIDDCDDMAWLKKYTKFGNVKLGKQYSCILEVELVNMDLRDGWQHASEVVSDERLITDISEVK